MKKILFIFLFLILSHTPRAQTVLLNVDNINGPKKSERGPNLKKFTHFYLRTGVLASKDLPGARIIYGPSANFAFGVRRKYKISRTYSMGFETEVGFTYYKLKQEKGKTLPDTIRNNISGRLDYSSIGLGYYNRINFDPQRGNFLGTFLDIGINGTWENSIKTISKNELQNGTIVKMVVHRLPYTNNLNAKVFARFGFSHISIYGSYRLTPLFKSSLYPELPKLLLGFDLAVF